MQRLPKVALDQPERHSIAEGTRTVDARSVPLRAIKDSHLGPNDNSGVICRKSEVIAK